MVAAVKDVLPEGWVVDVVGRVGQAGAVRLEGVDGGEGEGKHYEETDRTKEWKNSCSSF